MKVIGKDRTSCNPCNPIDEILARLDALERRASAIVAKVQGIAPDGEGNVTLPTSSSDTDPLHGRVDAFAMSSEVKEAADDAHAYAASIADDVVVLQSDVENLTREVEALDPASVTALEQSVAALQQTVNQLSNLVGGFSAVIRDLEDQMPNKVDRTGDTMAGPLNVIDTVTGSRNSQAVNGNRLQNDLDNYAPMVRDTENITIGGQKTFTQPIRGNLYSLIISRSLGYHKVFSFGNNTSSKYLAIRVNDRYDSADVRVIIGFDKSVSPPTISITGTTSSSINRTRLGVMYDDTKDEYLLIVNRVAGNNVYTVLTCDFYQIGTASINNALYPNVEDEIITINDTYNEIVIL